MGRHPFTAEKVRELMKQRRSDWCITAKQMAEKCECSEALIFMVENGDVTHPAIARRMQYYYKLTERQYETLIPEIHRPSSPKYEPDKYILRIETRPSIRINVDAKKIKKELERL